MFTSAVAGPKSVVVARTRGDDPTGLATERLPNVSLCANLSSLKKY